MQIQQGVVRYKDRTDLICNYGITDDGKQYYFLDDKPLPNGNIIASTALVEAIDPTVKASHAGVITKEGQVVIPLENKMVKNLGNNILLVERATPVSKTVLESIGLKNIPDAATKLVTTPAAIKDRLMGKMQNEGRFVFNDQFSEATIFDYNGKNLINNEYFSFIGMNSKYIYFSKNTVDSEIVEFSLFPEKVIADDNKEQINVQEIAKNNQQQIAQSINNQMIKNVNDDIPKHAAGVVQQTPPSVPGSMPTVPDMQNVNNSLVPLQQVATGVANAMQTNQNAPVIPVVSELQGMAGTVPSTNVVGTNTNSVVPKQNIAINNVGSVVGNTQNISNVPSSSVPTESQKINIPGDAPKDTVSVDAIPIAPEESEKGDIPGESPKEEVSVDAIPIAPEESEKGDIPGESPKEEVSVDAIPIAPEESEKDDIPGEGNEEISVEKTIVPDKNEEINFSKENLEKSSLDSIDVGKSEETITSEDSSKDKTQIEINSMEDEQIAPIEATPIAPEDVEDTVMANKNNKEFDDVQIPIVDDSEEEPVIPEVDEPEKIAKVAEKIEEDVDNIIEESEIVPEEQNKENDLDEEVSDDSEEKEESIENVFEKNEISLDDLEENKIDEEPDEKIHYNTSKKEKVVNDLFDYEQDFDVDEEDDDLETNSRDDLMNNRFRNSFDDRDDNFSDRDLFGDSLLNLDSLNIDYEDKRVTSSDMNIIDDITKSMTNLINLNKKQSNKIVDYEKAVARLRRSGNEISKKNKSLEDEIRFLNGKVRNYETIVSKLENRNRELDDRIQEQSKRLKDQEEEIQSLKPSARSKEELLKLIADANSLLDDDRELRRAI